MWQASTVIGEKQLRFSCQSVVQPDRICAKFHYSFLEHNTRPELKKKWRHFHQNPFNHLQWPCSFHTVQARSYVLVPYTWEVCYHLPYSPVLNLCDSDLVPKIKEPFPVVFPTKIEYSLKCLKFASAIPQPLRICKCHHICDHVNVILCLRNNLTFFGWNVVWLVNALSLVTWRGWTDWCRLDSQEDRFLFLIRKLDLKFYIIFFNKLIKKNHSQFNLFL